MIIIFSRSPHTLSIRKAQVFTIRHTGLEHTYQKLWENLRYMRKPHVSESLLIHFCEVPIRVAIRANINFIYNSLTGKYAAKVGNKIEIAKKTPKKYLFFALCAHPKQFCKLQTEYFFNLQKKRAKF